MIALRTSGIDDNPGAASAFVGIPQPVGVKDGDLLVVGISVTGAGVEVSPPTVDWTRIEQTDRAIALGVAVFWKFAFNEPIRWVFSLSSAAFESTGAVVVYLGADNFEPVEVAATALTTASTLHNVAAVSATLGAEELVLFLVGSSGSSYTPASGFQEVATNPQTFSTISIHRKQFANAGNVPAFTVTFGAAVLGASMIIVLRPSFGKLSLDDVRRRLVRGFPDGVEDIYDLEQGGDYYKYFQSIAQALKVFGFDFLDLLRSEIIPSFTRYKLPDWEAIFGLETTRVALLGTIPQRQAQIAGAWRGAAQQGSSIPEINAVLGPIFGYFPTTPVEVIEPDAAALRVLHSYGFPSDIVIPAGATAEIFIYVRDGDLVSTAGAHLTLNFTSTNITGFVVTLIDPNKVVTRVWTILEDIVPMNLFGPEFIGQAIHRDWTLRVQNTSGSSNTLQATSKLIVEGMPVPLVQGGNPKQETAAAIYDWGVYADPLYLSENGTPADFDAARLAIQHLAFAHTIGRLIQSKVPYPDVTAGANSSIPDECDPV